MRRTAWTLLCLGLLITDKVVCVQEQCTNPTATSMGTKNFARMCGVSENNNCGAIASSTWSDTPPPSAAVDGIYSSSADSGHQNIFHTLANGWWRVDFGVQRRLQRIYIRNRFQAATHHALNNAQILVGDTDSVTGNTVCATVVNAGLDNYITCVGIGRFLFVVGRPNSFLFFSELEAYGLCACPADQYGPSAGSGPCAVCPDPNNVSLAGSTSVVSCTCPGGSFGIEGVCTNCPAGQNSIAGATAIIYI